MTKWLNSLQPLGAFMMRLVLGVCMTIHGYQKVVPRGALHHFAHYVASLGLPYWLGYVSAFTEFIGGMFLIVGLLTRLASALVAVNMLVAFATVGIHQGSSMSINILALASMALMLLSCGAGALSFDRRLGFS
jgi:putative oxidoreductase